MKILSFDTSSPACAIAVVDGDGAGADVLSEITVWAPREHLARLIPQIDAALREAQTAKEDVQAIAVGIGPGSYTGLRIGVTVARTLAQALNISIVGIPSLDAMARRFMEFDGFVCPVIDAKRGEVYAAVYETGNGFFRRKSDFRPLSPEALLYELVALGARVLMVGDGIYAYRDIFESHLGTRISFAPRDYWWPRASDLAVIALKRLARGQSDDLFSLVPIYARLSQAEELLLKKGNCS